MSTNKHPIDQDELMAYLDGELPMDRATAAVLHLERCPDCQAFAADVRNVSQQLMAWEVEATDPRIPAKVIAALEQRQQKPEGSRISLPTFRNRVMTRRWAWAGAFVILCVLTGVGIKLAAPKRMAMLAAVQPQTEVRERTSDSNGLFHGLGDQAENSFSRDGQPLTPQKDKVGTGTAGKLVSPVNGREFDRLQQFAKLQNPPPAKFQASDAAGPMIVRSAGVALTTNDFDHARTGLDEILKHHHGYVGELNVSTPTGSGRSFTATLRVPADQLDATIADLRKLGRLESESQSGQEVTAQYVDLQARLSNARNTEQRLTDLLKQRTGKLSDVLAVETQIDRVRGEIERMEAERKTLTNQVDFATINATVAEDYRAQLQLAPVSTSGRVRNAAVEGYRTMVEGVVGVVLFFLTYGPTLLLWGAILFFPARAAWRKVQRTFAR